MHTNRADEMTPPSKTIRSFKQVVRPKHDHLSENAFTSTASARGSNRRGQRGEKVVTGYATRVGLREERVQWNFAGTNGMKSISVNMALNRRKPSSLFGMHEPLSRKQGAMKNGGSAGKTPTGDICKLCSSWIQMTPFSSFTPDV